VKDVMTSAILYRRLAPIAGCCHLANYLSDVSVAGKMKSGR